MPNPGAGEMFRAARRGRAPFIQPCIRRRADPRLQLRFKRPRPPQTLRHAQRGRGWTTSPRRFASPAVRSPDRPEEAAGRAENVPPGILLMIVATVLFAGASAASKWLVAIYPVGEVLFLRSLSSFIGVRRR